MKVATGIFVWTVRASLFLMLSVRFTKSCSCKEEVPQNQYCNADYVVLIEVLGRREIDEDTIVYNIDVLEEYKMTEETRRAFSKGLLKTVYRRHACHVEFQETKYLIGGQAISGDKIPSIHLCGVWHKWTSLTPMQQLGFSGLYAMGCDCGGKFQYVECRSDERIWRCEKHSFCARQGGSCAWVKHSNYLRCMRGATAGKKFV